MYCTKCGTQIIGNASFCVQCGQPVTKMMESTYSQPNLGYGQSLHGPSIQKVTGEPSVVVDTIFLVVNIFIDITILAAEDFIWFFILFPFTILTLVRLINALSIKIIVDETGVTGKIKKERFHLGYHEISSVSMSDRNDNKNLLIISGYKTYSIKIKNARVVRDAIENNMAVLGITPAPMKQPASAAANSTPTASSPANVLYKREYPAIVITDSLRQQIAEFFWHKTDSLPRNKLHALEEIPPKKLENAIKSYAPSVGSNSDEKAILLYDDTAGSSAKIGFMLTTKCLYSKSTMEEATMCYVKNIVEVIGENKSKFAYRITVGTDIGTYAEIVLSVVTTQAEREAIVYVLDKTISLLKSNETSC